MRLYYNPELFFRGLDKNKVDKYYKKIFDLANDLELSGYLDQNIIDKYKFKKMRGTDTIFKFYLDNQDGMRCLVKYEEIDDEVFKEGSGLFLLRISDHNSQGTIGKALDGKLISYENFLVSNDDIEGNDNDFKNFLGKQYLKTVLFDQAISIEEFIKLMQDTNTKSLYRLSENQIMSLNAQGPVFLMGSAGSGKTLVEISKVLKNSFSKIDQIYFTYTSLLKDTAFNLYKKYNKIDGMISKTEFYTVADYLLEINGFKPKNHMNLERFLNFMKERKFSDRYPIINKIDYFDLWSEIRGLIKGYVGNDYYRIIEFTYDAKVLKKEQLEYLLKNYIVGNVAGSNSKYIIKDSVQLYEYNNENAKLFHNQLIEQDLNFPLLDETNYINNMNEKYSKFEEKERKQIYNFVKNEYQAYLQKEDLYDDNDLSRMLIKQIYDDENFNKFDYIYIDEVQDLTELQIFALSKLSRYPNNIFMTGDVSQVVNPTFFDDGRIGMIYKLHFNTKINTDLKLVENYRNSENIVNVLKVLLDIRQRTIGKYDYDIIEESVELEKKEGLPIYVDVEHEIMTDVILKWIDVPNVAIVVSSRLAKNQLEKELKKNNITNIFTVSEVKGQEFDKIISYNLMSDFKEAWNKIASDKVKKGSNAARRFRYYFNILYVSLTRGRVNLYMYEDEKELDILKEILPFFESIKDNVFDVMNIKEYDTEENREKQANLYFNQKEYKRARNYYLQLNNRRMAQISNGLLNLSEGKYKQGIESLYIYQEYQETIFDYLHQKETLLYAIFGYKTRKINEKQLYSIIGNRSLFELAREFKNSKIYTNILIDIFKIIGTVKSKEVTANINRIKKGISL